MQTSKTLQVGISTRFETPADLQAIRRVHMQAFGRPAEANLVDVLRKHWQHMISLVAETENQVVGHLLLTHVILRPNMPGLRLLGLGPVAVLPEFQRQEIGSKLIRQGIGEAQADSWQAVVAFGLPEFFTRFGFIPADRFGLSCEFQVPKDSFMVLELQAGALEAVQGVVRYQPEFSGF